MFYLPARFARCEKYDRKENHEYKSEDDSSSLEFVFEMDPTEGSCLGFDRAVLSGWNLDNIRRVESVSRFVVNRRYRFASKEKLGYSMTQTLLAEVPSLAVPA